MDVGLLIVGGSVVLSMFVVLLAEATDEDEDYDNK